MSMYITKNLAEKGKYSYCVNCGKVTYALWTGAVSLSAEASPGVRVALPAFCDCQNAESKRKVKP